MSKFYELPGSHKPSHASESTPLVSSSSSSRRESLTYFTYSDAPKQGKQSSKYDPENPNKHKLGTFGGVFVPTTLNVLSILMFLRFGFILGQMGVLGTLLLLILSYCIDLLTTLSISAISTNGTVRGGGAYYMISRSLGPEFGGSIGLVFFLGQIFNSGMNVVGIIEPLLYNFGYKIDLETPVLMELLPRGYWWQFTYATMILLLCLAIALIGSATVSKAGNVLFWLLLASTLSIPFSAMIKPAFSDGEITYTGPSWNTLKGNLFPHFTKGAAGSLLKGKENFNDMFGIFFPATAGIFAGAGMSSELRKPSKSIPKGTLWGLLLTFSCYFLVVLTLGCSVPRESLYKDVQIIQTVSSSQVLILAGELSTSVFSIIVGILGAAYVLQAIAKDSILPGLSIFHRKPIWSLLFAWFLTQLCLFSDVNQIATFITMTFLITFIVMNLACFLLEISSAPNFRPSFKYFDWYTALTGAVLSIIAMFIVDGISAASVILCMVLLFILIHFSCPPKTWGDVSQNLIYHQVRKYLLRLRQDNVKYWRPQVLLLVDNPRTGWNLIRFCNHLKKGGLYILGHVTVSNNFQCNYNELRKQTRAWIKIRDMTKIKAFVQIGTGPTLPWGVRNVFLGSGLGGMKPNITVLGFFDLSNYYETKKSRLPKVSPSENSRQTSYLKAVKKGDGSVSIDMPEVLGSLPTDDSKNEAKITVQQWVQVIEDLSLMQSNIAIAKGFGGLILPSKYEKLSSGNKRFIDLYPIQMSAKVVLNDSSSESILTTNFDTYTLILQLGAILATVPDWKATHRLRVIVFVEKESERFDENKRIHNLLNVLRIEAEVLVLSLDQFRVYNTIVKGDSISFDHVNSVLQDDEWWEDLVLARKTRKSARRFSVPIMANINEPHHPSFSDNKRYNVSNLQRLGVSLTMTSNMPLNGKDSPYFTYDSDDDYDTDSILCSSSTLQNTEADHSDLGTTSNSGKKCPKNKPSRSKLKSDKSVRSTMPVFTSDALPKTKVIEEATGDEPSLIPVVDNDETVSSSTSNGEAKRNIVLPVLSPCQSIDSLTTDLHNVSFNEVPSKAQHLILNDVMTQVSKGSHLIFSTLPIPPLGTHKDGKASLQYIEDLDVWLEGLPPTMLINSQSMTVTTAL